MTQTNIIVKLEVEGMHCWPKAAELLPEVGFLSDNHRHIFHIVAKKKVSHSDRDVEIILFKREMITWLYEMYGVQAGPDAHYKWCKFGAMSCELIAEELLKQFDLEYCSVLEDNENGAECFSVTQSVTNIYHNTGKNL